MLKPSLSPPPAKDLEARIRMNGMGVGTLGILMDGKEDTVDVP